MISKFSGSALLCASIFLLALGSISAQSNDLDVNELEKKLQEVPGLENFNSSKLPSQEDLEKLLKQKCVDNGGGEEAFDALKNQQTEVKECVEQYLNFTQIQLEIEDAKKTGSMDEVIGKYCKKYPEIFGCFVSVTEKIRPCLAPKEQSTMDQALNMTHELKEFLCFKDGDRIAMFIAEGGFDCLDQQKEGLQQCANSTIGSRIPTDLSISNLPMFLLTERECDDFDKIRKCFNVELEKCKNTSPANIVDALFKFLKKQTPCENRIKAASVAGGNGAQSRFARSLDTPQNTRTAIKSGPIKYQNIQSQDTLGLTEQDCINNGGDKKAFQSLQNSQLLMQQCTLQHIDRNVGATIQKSIIEKKGDIQKIISTEICPKTAVLLECSDNVTAAIKPCFKAKDQENVDKTVVIIKDIVKTLCKDQAKAVSEFLLDDGIDCVQSSVPKLIPCTVNTTFEDILKAENTSGKVMILNINSSQCGDLEVVKQCVNTVLSKCPKPSSAKFINTIFSVLKRNSPCHDKSVTVDEEDNGAGFTRVPFTFLLVSLIVLIKNIF